MSERPELMPADTPDYMAPAWGACMSWALGNAAIRAEFEADTGRKWVAPKNAIDRAIDKATGHGDDYVRAFIEWANVNVWGPMDGEH